MTKRSTTSSAETEVDRKVKKEDPEEAAAAAAAGGGSLKEQLAAMTKEELIVKYENLAADYDVLKSRLRKTEGSEHLARIRYTLKDREHRIIAQDRCNARWKLLGDANSVIVHKRGLQVEGFIHDTLLAQRDELHGLKKDVESARAELATLRGKASEENSKEWERVRKLKEESEKLRGDAKKKAEMEKQLALSQRANAVYKAKFRELEKEIAEKNSRIRLLEEAPRAEEEEEMEEEGEGAEIEEVEGGGEEKVGEVKEEEEEVEELMLDDGHGEEEDSKADE